MAYLTPLFTSSTGAVTNTAVSYQGVACGNIASTSTIGPRNLPLPMACTAIEFFVQIDTAPGVGKSYTFEIYKNSASTGASVVISDNATQSSVLSTSISFNAGDDIVIQITPSGTPTVISSLYMRTVFSANTSMLFCGTSTSISTAVSTAATLGAFSLGGITSTTETAVGLVVPPDCGGTLDKLYVLLNGSPGASKSYTYTIYKNGSPTSLTCTVSGTNTTANDTSNSVTIAAGDRITVYVTPSGTPTARGIKCSVQFTPTKPGITMWAYTSTNYPSNFTTQYDQILGTGFGSWGTEATRNNLLPRYLLHSMACYAPTAPGSGASFAFTLRNNNASSNISMVLSDTNNYASGVGGMVVETGNKCAIQSVPSNVPAIGGTLCLAFSFLIPNTTPVSLLPLLGVGQ